MVKIHTKDSFKKKVIQFLGAIRILIIYRQKKEIKLNLKM
jgi:hypothetical protein